MRRFSLILPSSGNTLACGDAFQKSKLTLARGGYELLILWKNQSFFYFKKKKPIYNL